MASKSEIYAKAAEVIVRDGQAKGTLFLSYPVVNGFPTDQDLKDGAAGGGKVCAIGACLRAEYELNGRLSRETLEDCYATYTFRATNDVGVPAAIYGINDKPHTTAEDIALLLKKRAADEL